MTFLNPFLLNFFKIASRSHHILNYCILVNSKIEANFEPDKFGAFFSFGAIHVRRMGDHGRMISRDKGKKMLDSFSFSFFFIHSECPIFVRLWWRMNYNEEKLFCLHFYFCFFSFMSPNCSINEIKRKIDHKILKYFNIFGIKSRGKRFNGFRG